MTVRSNVADCLFTLGLGAVGVCLFIAVDRLRGWLQSIAVVLLLLFMAAYMAGALWEAAFWWDEVDNRNDSNGEDILNV